eukprot:7718736-Prorocentrum_lima.AAC.1
MQVEAPAGQAAALPIQGAAPSSSFQGDTGMSPEAGGVEARDTAIANRWAILVPKMLFQAAQKQL